MKSAEIEKKLSFNNTTNIDDDDSDYDAIALSSNNPKNSDHHNNQSSILRKQAYVEQDELLKLEQYKGIKTTRAELGLNINKNDDSLTSNNQQQPKIDIEYIKANNFTTNTSLMDLITEVNDDEYILSKDTFSSDLNKSKAVTIQHNDYENLLHLRIQLQQPLNIVNNLPKYHLHQLITQKDLKLKRKYHKVSKNIQKIMKNLSLYQNYISLILKQQEENDDNALVEQQQEDQLDDLEEDQLDGLEEDQQVMKE